MPKPDQHKEYATAMVFGVFDGLHDGHRYFLTRARERCRILTVVVTPPEAVTLLKKRAPKRSYEERVSQIAAFDPKLKIVRGDVSPGKWELFDSENPDIILLGHDQHGIARELKKLGRQFEFLSAFHPEKYSSSLLNRDSAV